MGLGATEAECEEVGAEPAVEKVGFHLEKLVWGGGELWASKAWLKYFLPHYSKKWLVI